MKHLIFWYVVLNLLLVPFHAVYLFSIGWEAEKITLWDIAGHGLLACLPNLIFFVVLWFFKPALRLKNKQYFLIFSTLVIGVYVLLGLDHILNV